MPDMMAISDLGNTLTTLGLEAILVLLKNMSEFDN